MHLYASVQIIHQISPLLCCSLSFCCYYCVVIRLLFIFRRTKIVAPLMCMYRFVQCFTSNSTLTIDYDFLLLIVMVRILFILLFFNKIKVFFSFLRLCSLLYISSFYGIFIYTLIHKATATITKQQQIITHSLTYQKIK